MPTTSLRDKTIQLLENRSIKLTFALIASKTGLNERWIRELSQKKIPNPGVNTVQTLFEFLNKAPLKF